MFPACRELRRFVPAAYSAIRISRPEIDLPACESLQRPAGGWRLRDNAIRSDSIRLRGNRLPHLCRARLFPEARQHFDLGGSFALPAGPRQLRRVDSYGSACNPTTPRGWLTPEKVFWLSRLIPAPCCIRSSSAPRRCAHLGWPAIDRADGLRKAPSLRNALALCPVHAAEVRTHLRPDGRVRRASPRLVRRAKLAPPGSQ